jgi:hypothetical protein
MRTGRTSGTFDRPERLGEDSFPITLERLDELPRLIDHLERINRGNFRFERVGQGG